MCKYLEKGILFRRVCFSKIKFRVIKDNYNLGNGDLFFYFSLRGFIF